MTERHTAIDYAHALKHVADEISRTPKKSCSSRTILTRTSPLPSIEAFAAQGGAPPDRALRMALHAKARELARLGRERTQRPRLAISRPPHRRPTNASRGEVAAWDVNRNKNHAKADWQFTTEDARVKLKPLYPIFPVQNG